jgi:Ser/Thr protein kinase RdoA (MazF antagonist)
MAGSNSAVNFWPDQLLMEITRLWPGQALSLQRLYGDTDQNIRIFYPDARSQVLKITGSGSAGAAAGIDLQVAVLNHIRGETGAFTCPVPCLANDGKYVQQVLDNKGIEHHAWMLEWLPGRLLDEVKEYDDKRLHSIGQAVATVDRALLDFDHPAAHRHSSWDLANILELRIDLAHISVPADRQLAEDAFVLLERQLLPRLALRPRSLIHNDGGNQHNMLLPAADGDNSRIAGVIDFGDCVNTYRLCGLGIAAAYSSFGHSDIILAITRCAAGYHAVLPLEDVDWQLLPLLVAARFLTSICHAAERASREPENAYAQVSAESAWRGLRYMMSIDAQSLSVQLDEEDYDG